MAKNKAKTSAQKNNSTKKSDSKNILHRDLGDISPDFSVLDRAIHHALVDGLHSAPGALPRENLEALVGEVIELNSGRAQSHFHRGYLDALLAQPLRKPESGDSEERRWYLCGYLETQADAEKPELLKSLDGNDRKTLLKQGSQASAILFPQLIGPLLEANDLKDARNWIESHAQPGDLHFAKVVHDWAHPAMLKMDKLKEIEELLAIVSGKLAGAGGGNENSELPALARRIERIYAICLRMEKHFGDSLARLDGLLENGGDSTDRQDLLAQRALCKLEMDRYEEIAFPLKERHRKLLPEAAEALKEAAQGENASPLALVLLAFPAIPANAEAELAPAIERLQRAVAAMQQSGQSEGGGKLVWERSGLLDRARFYLAFLELRTGKKGKTARRAVEQLSELLRSGVRFPGECAELELEAMTLASESDPRSAAELAPLMLKLHGFAALGALNEALAAQSQDLRAELASLLDSADAPKQLNAGERWNAWLLLLRGCNKANKPDLKMACDALDALEILAQTEKKTGEFIAFLEDQHGDWRPGWDAFEQHEALVRLHRESGNPEKAMAGCFELAQSYISKKRFTEAQSAMEAMRELNPEGKALEALEALESRLQKETESKRGDEEKEDEDRTPVSLIFVGGNEKQENYRAKLDKEMAEQNVAIEWHFTNWNSNWGRIKDELSNRIHRADAVILMQFVRTGLGQSVRSLAGRYDKPWIPCPGHGHNSLRQAILKAAQVARRTKAGSGA